MSQPPNPPSTSSTETPPAAPPPGSPRTAVPALALAWLRHSQTLRLLGVGFLVLLLQIPLEMIESVVWERQSYRAEAVTDVTSKWGGHQVIAGPRLVVPVTRTIPGKPRQNPDWSPHPDTKQERLLHLMPKQLAAEADLETQTLHRGIFDVPVYELAVGLTGEFAAPAVAALVGPTDEVHWDRAALVIEVSDPRAISRSVDVRWGDDAIAFQPGAGPANLARPAIHAPLGKRAKRSATFAIELEMKGSESFHLAALGEETVLHAAANWPDPSFQGAWLPTERDVRADGFDAEWSVPALGRNFPQQWVEVVDRASGNPGTLPYVGAAGASEAYFAAFVPVGSSRGAVLGPPGTPIPANLAAGAISAPMPSVGFRLVTPVDPYRMAQRSAKYATLFLLLTFGTLWLFEVLAGVRVHWVQYALVGAAMCLFYLLEISLAEHLGFGMAYAFAASGVVALIAAYAAAILGRSRRAAMVAGILAALYGYLYVLLMNQDYALLSGSVGLFVTLGVVMFLTRHVDWGTVGQMEENRDAAEAS